MVEIYLQRRGSVLVPISASDDVEIKRLPERRLLTAEINGKTPMKIQRWYRAAVQLLTEATGRWPNRDIAHNEIMIRAGYFESMTISTDGTTRYFAASTREWGLVEWREAMDRLIPVLIMFAGETPAQYRNRVDAFLGIKLKEAMEG